MIETRSAATALNKHKGLQQFFKWLMLDEQEIDRSPMERVRQPKTPTKLIPVIRDEDTRKLLDVCKGKDFASLCDALIRLYYNTGARLSEAGNLLIDDIDLNTAAQPDRWQSTACAPADRFGNPLFGKHQVQRDRYIQVPNLTADGHQPRQRLGPHCWQSPETVETSDVVILRFLILDGSRADRGRPRACPRLTAPRGIEAPGSRAGRRPVASAMRSTLEAGGAAP
jgi:hypothetical protein